MWRSIGFRQDENMNVRLGVSVPEELAHTARAAVANGYAASISAYVAAAMDYYRRQQTLEEFLAELDAEVGPVPDDVREQTVADFHRAVRNAAAKRKAP